MPIDDDHEVKLRRMLLWFESQLPAHDLREWHFEAQPVAVTIVDDRVAFMGSSYTWGHLVGNVRCQRCAGYFKLPPNEITLYAEEDDERLAIEYPTLTRAARIEEAKERLRGQAERSGPCWGDIPHQAPCASRIRCG